LTWSDNNAARLGWAFLPPKETLYPHSTPGLIVGSEIAGD
jgi:hypothetical protein